MDRFKNYGLLLAIFAFIPMFLQSFGVNVLPINYTEIVNAFLGILVLAGVINNPTSGSGYVDEKTELK